MFFFILSLLLLKSLVALTKASPVSTTDASSKDFDLSLLNTSNLNNITLGTNSTVPTLSVLPYSFAVPNTQTFLRLGFGLPRRHLDPMSLGGLLAVVQDIISEGIRVDGEDAHPGVDPLFMYQTVDYSLGDGFRLVVDSRLPATSFFTLAQLRNVVRGLELYLVEGGRPYATVFSFWDGPRSWWTSPLGHGAVALGNEEVEIADQKL